MLFLAKKCGSSCSGSYEIYCLQESSTGKKVKLVSSDDLAFSFYTTFQP